MLLLASKTGNVNDNLTNTIKLNKSLANKYSSGRNLALISLRRLMSTPLYYAFSRWKQNTQKSIIVEMWYLIDEKKSNLRMLKDIKNDLEDQNENLSAEHEELRHTSIDGLEIANVIYK